jgi:pheromone shutdown-related protein TraB
MEVKVNENIVLIGTAHISRESVREVEEAIERHNPAVVAIELCKRRYETLTKKKKWENTPVNQLLKSNNAYLLLAQTFLSSIQRRLGKEYGVEPGSEMIAAMREAEKRGIEVALVDRDISITLKRAWRRMGLIEKFKLTWEFIKAIVGFEEKEELDIEKIMDQDVISTMLEEFRRIAPTTTSVLIHERDKYIAKKIKEESKKGKVVAVVGAGHLKGIKDYLEKDLDVDIGTLEYVPKKRFSFIKTIGYMVPLIFAALIVYIYIFGSWGQALDAIKWWFIINGTLSAIGAALARGHPFSIATAFIAAPLTSLNPAIAAGWVAGYVEFKMRKPVIKDFTDLSKLDSFRDFWNNKVIRLLMVVALANVGSMIGTFVALSYIGSLGVGI